MRDGIRTATTANNKNLYVFCQAGRYQQLFLIDDNGKEISRDIPKVLGTIKCGPAKQGFKVPSNYNKAVMKVKRKFVEEAKHRESDRKHSLSLTVSQRYVLREFRILFSNTDDDDVKGQINILEKAFRGPITTAINRELNSLRRNGVSGDNLMRSLIQIYHQHNMKEWVDRNSLRLNEHPIPKIICSEGFV